MLQEVGILETCNDIELTRITSEHIMKPLYKFPLQYFTFLWAFAAGIAACVVLVMLRRFVNRFPIFNITTKMAFFCFSL